MTLLKSPDLFKTAAGLNKSKDWTDYLFAAILRETGNKWKPTKNIISLWSRVLKTRIDSEVNPFVFALMVDTISIDWGKHGILTPWQLTSAEHIFRFFVGRSWWHWKAVWFSRYAKGEKETSLYIEYLVKSEVAHDMSDGVEGKSNALQSCKRILQGFEEKVIERRQGDAPSFELHWVKEKYGEWNS